MRILHNKGFLALAVCVGLSNCKSVQQSETRSLENFAAGQTIKVNTCSNAQGGLDMIDQEVSALIDGLGLIQAPKNLEGDVSSTISAMPVNLLNMYFTTGNRIIVSNKAFNGKNDSGISDCKIARKNRQVLAQDFYSATKGLDSCVVKESPESGTTRVSIYIEENSGAIHHNLIRRMSQVVSMHLSKLQSSSSGLSITDSVDGDFARWQKDMVAAVNLDIEKLSDDRAEGYLKTKKQLDSQKFAEHVFSESMDSYFCSAASYESMEKDFPNAFKSFKELEAGLLALWTAEEAQSTLNLSRRRPIRRILGGAGRAAYNTSRVVGRAAIRVGRGAARVGKAVRTGVRQAGAVIGRAVVGTGRVILQGGRNVIRHATRGIRNEIKFRRSTGYVFPRLHGYRRR